MLSRLWSTTKHNEQEEARRVLRGSWCSLWYKTAAPLRSLQPACHERVIGNEVRVDFKSLLPTIVISNGARVDFKLLADGSAERKL